MILYKPSLQASVGSIMHLKWFKTGTRFDLVSMLYSLYYFIFLDVHLTVWDIPKEPKWLHCLPLFIGLMQKPFGGCMSDLQIQISWATNLQCWKHKVQWSGNVCFCTECVFVNVPVSGFVRGVLSAPKQLCNSVSVSCIFLRWHCICAKLSENTQVRNISVFSGLWVSLNEFGQKAINTRQWPDAI